MTFHEFQSLAKAHRIMADILIKYIHSGDEDEFMHLRNLKFGEIEDMLQDLSTKAIGCSGCGGTGTKFYETTGQTTDCPSCDGHGGFFKLWDVEVDL